MRTSASIASSRRKFVVWYRSLDRRTVTWLGVSAGTLLVGFVVGGLYGDLLLDRGIPVTVSDKPDINRLIQRVSRHMVVNTGANPDVATVKDPDLLREQNPVFFKDAQEGDRLIVWSDRAVLYSPSRDLVLAALVAPNIQAPWAADAAAAQGQAAQQLTFEVRNGSGKAGAAQVLADRLKENGFTVAAVKDAAKVYPETRVVLVSDKAKGADAAALTRLTGGIAGDLPAGEQASTADILVIVGTDQS